jgi:hypothetical protein
METWGWVLPVLAGVVIFVLIKLVVYLYGRLAESRDIAKRSERVKGEAISEKGRFEENLRVANERIGDLEYQLREAQDRNQFASSQAIVDAAMEAACLRINTLAGKSVACGMLRFLERYDEGIVNGQLPGLLIWAVACGQAVDQGESPLSTKSAREAAEKFGDLDGHTAILDEIFEWLEYLANAGDADATAPDEPLEARG